MPVLQPTLSPRPMSRSTGPHQTTTSTPTTLLSATVPSVAAPVSIRASNPGPMKLPTVMPVIQESIPLVQSQERPTVVSNSSSRLSNGTIVGIVAGMCCVVSIVVGMGVAYNRHKLGLDVERWCLAHRMPNDSGNNRMSLNDDTTKQIHPTWVDSGVRQPASIFRR
jgi:hypothetical protein